MARRTCGPLRQRKSRLMYGPKKPIEMRRWMLIAISVLLLGACKMGPEYMRPETQSEDAWRMAPASAESLANLPWWELLKDEELQKLIRISLAENQDLRVAVASVEQFRAQLLISKFDLAPSLGYQAGGLTFHNTNDQALTFGEGISIPNPSGGSNGGTDFSYLSGMIGLKWEIDLWGRIRRSIEAAQAQLLSQEENQRAVVLRLVGSVAEAYLDLRALDLQIEVTQRTLKAWDDSVRISRLRFQHGDIPKLDLDQFEAERAGTAAHLTELEQQAVQQENHISLLLGRRPMAIPRGLALTKQSLPPNVPPGLPSALLQRRPDIVQAEQELTAATAQIGVAQAQRFPQFALTGSAGGAGFHLNSLAAGPFATLGASATVTGPLLNATALGYQVQSVEAQERQAVARYQKAVLTAFKEVEDSLIAVQKSRERAEAQEQQVRSLQSA
ncbi:MAG TPA: efflux transporter outer membrane subunit, partial [Nitrospiraceae bacterium]|nr:efflux transporter outer membrane subunit [Nitrospiraceae bacterium]